MYNGSVLRHLSADGGRFSRKSNNKLCDSKRTNYCGCYGDPIYFFGSSGVASHKGAYGALFKVRCMVVNHMAKVPLGALNERSTGNIKTVLNEDIEKLELF